MTDHREQIEEDEKRLDELGREIDEVRSHTPEFKREHEPHFIDEGEQDTGDVDDTIAPPG